MNSIHTSKIFGVVFVALAVAGFLAFFPLETLGVVILVFFFVFALIKPSFLVVMVLVIESGIFPENRLPKLPMMGGAIHFSDLVMISAAVLVFIRILSDHRCFLDLKRSTLFAPLTIIFGMAALSVARSLFFSTGADPRLVFNEFRPFFYWFVTFLALVVTIRSERDFRLLIQSVLVLAALAAIVVIVETKFGTGWTGAQLRRAEVEGGGTLHSIHRVGIGGLSLLLFGCYFWALRIFGERLKMRNAWLVFLGLVATFFSLNRIKLLCLLMGFLILRSFLPKRYRGRYLAALVSIFCFTLLLFFIPQSSTLTSVKERFVSIFSQSTYRGSSLGWRYEENRDALRHIRKHPVAGIGLGAPYRQIGYQRAFPGALSYIHQGYLFFVLKLGLLSLVPFLWMSVIFFRNCGALFRKSMNPYHRDVAAAACVTYISLLVSNVTQPEFHDTATVELIAILFFLTEPFFSRTVGSIQAR